MAFIELTHQNGRTYLLLIVDDETGKRTEVALDRDEVQTLGDGCLTVLEDVSEQYESSAINLYGPPSAGHRRAANHPGHPVRARSDPASTLPDSW